MVVGTTLGGRVMERLFTRDAANATLFSDLSAVPTERWENRSHTNMADESAPEVGQTYRSLRTGQSLIVTAIDNDLVYYRVDGFATVDPLFLPLDKFNHLVGLTSLRQI